jgi:predicted ATPase
MFWSPVVRPGLVKELDNAGFELFINEKYSEAISQLRRKARASTADANNPAYRVLQILEHLRPISAA